MPCCLFKICFWSMKRIWETNTTCCTWLRTAKRGYSLLPICSVYRPVGHFYPLPIYYMSWVNYGEIFLLDECFIVELSGISIEKVNRFHFFVLRCSAILEGMFCNNQYVPSVVLTGHFLKGRVESVFANQTTMGKTNQELFYFSSFLPRISSHRFMTAVSNWTSCLKRKKLPSQHKKVRLFFVKEFIGTGHVVPIFFKQKRTSSTKVPCGIRSI